MKCPSCRREIPDGQLTCRACLEKRSAADLRKTQYRPLLTVAHGKAMFTTRAVADLRHIQLFGYERAFCGFEPQSYHRRGLYSLESLLGPAAGICQECRVEIAKALKEARACPDAAGATSQGDLFADLQGA